MARQKKTVKKRSSSGTVSRQKKSLQKKPVILVNCKTYPQGTGKYAVALAKHCERAVRKYGVDIRIAVQPTDIARVAAAVSIPVYAQHVDCAEPGRTTGWFTVHALKMAGGAGSLLNHAEHQLPVNVVARTAQQLRNAKLDAIVIAENIDRLMELQTVDAAFFSIEPPELIGGNISVSVAQPDVVKNAVHASKKPLLIGAGIKTTQDYQIALSLGSAGVLLASGIVLAKNQEKALGELLKR